ILITGSNMSGKSTLLRTAGLNLVLAYTGAPVCAENFRCSVMRVYTCMRVTDNIEQSISSFYAELLRIKTIVQAARERGQVFFLLDEIFKGTNSQDRHTGAKILIKQLSKQGAMGMVSTHDLELSELEKESKGQIRNYHFREYYENDQIRFDYLLRSGPSTTRNALYLIKLAGIELEQT
ncbi:MAG TPA: DNA mismatch repair protein, partial [Verrucomicrobiae bacterium]|nr:DNA mismatch repair protein [Verrucomicrobiae bacterium]